MPGISNTLKISRSGLKLFLECPRCFWLDLHHKIKRPPGYPYTLSAAIDYLVKQEFDTYRKKGELPPVFKDFKKEAKLFSGKELEEWRNNFKGVRYFDEDLNAILYGAVDDILEFSDSSLAVVDYKSSGSKEVHVYDDYQKQMEIYSFLLNKNGYEVQPRAFFVFYIVDKTGGGFKNVLPFREELKEVKVDYDWVAPAFEHAVEIARQNEPPILADTSHCDHCHYVEMAGKYQFPVDLNI